jgi:hypothetical protein
MAIGDVKVKEGRNVYQRENIIPGQFGEGIAKAINGFGDALGDVSAIALGLHERANKAEEFATRKSFIEHEGEQARIQAEQHRTAEPGAAGVTNAVEERIRLSNAAWLEQTPERLRTQYEPLLETLAQGQSARTD